MYNNYIKRIIDFLISLIALIVLSPVFVIIILILWAYNGKEGAFFLQDRPGKRGKPFKVIKFKTMNGKRNYEGNLLPDLQRITPFGAFVRKTSLDEIPQLINVLMGDMALIGPRPLLMQYLSLYSEEQMRRHDVRPGITGWAQVNGRNNLSWTEKFKLDVWYVDNLSLALDIKIILLTILKVFKRESINNAKSTQFTTECFNGYN